MSNIAKRVSNYELFYDLVFVMATSSMVQMFHHVGEHHLGWYELLQFVVSNFSIWGLWGTQNIYMNKYSRRDRNDIYAIIASMLLIGNMTLAISSDWRVTSLNFNGLDVPTYVVFNLLLMLSYGLILLQYVLHIRRYQTYTHDMKLQIRLIIFTIAMIFLAMVLVGFVPAQYGAYVFAAAYTLIMGAPLMMRHKMDHDVINFPHLVERLQLITILTYGEAVIGVIRSYPLADNWLQAVLVFVAIGFAFINYISQTAIGLDHHQNEVPFLLIYSHLVLVIGINMFTVGVELLPSDGEHATSCLLMVLGAAVYHICILLTMRYNKEELRLTPRTLMGYILVLAVGFTAVVFFKGDTLLLFLSFAIMEYAMIRVGYQDRLRWVKENIKF